MINLKNRLIAVYFVILIFLTSGITWLYINSDLSLSGSNKEIANIEVMRAKNFGENIITQIQSLAPLNLVQTIKESKKLQRRITNILSLFSNEQYRYVYLIYPDSQGKLRYLADGSKELNQRGELNQKFDPLSPLWTEVIKNKKPIYTTQQNISDLWITYLYPIVKANKIEAILAFDISAKEYTDLMKVVTPLHNFLLIISIFMVFILIFSLFQMYLYLKQQKKTNIDALTRLYNRHYLDEKRKDIDLSKCAIIIVDIDHFKRINDNFGHDVGDIVLETIAKRLLSATRIFDAVIRYGGEEFLIILHKQVDTKTIREISNRILSSVSKQPIRAETRNLHVTVSMGINPPTIDKISLEEAIANADRMLYLAKTSGRNRIVILNEEIGDSHILLIDEVSLAIQEERLCAYFQPILDIKTNKIKKYEALVRIIGKDGRVFVPAQFLRMIKKTGVYRALTKSILLEAFDTIKKNNISVSVNFDVGDFFDDTLFENVKDLISENIKYANLLTIEILEDTLISDMDNFVKRLNILKKMNIQIAIDDFGSGYSSFNYLIHIRPDILKIDGSIISKLLIDENAKTIIQGIVNICKSLNICSIAEFVESAEVLEILKGYGVDMAQGYYIGRPNKSLVNTNFGTVINY
ncbi:MAG: bifunctional diguanylate cyclase/phosphodiesterase [Sulfurospirillaceae bacterium]|nr:bifunctional diguanylate cyclase/phosphodiesterase [Sulfurospirillaceae bacterium]